jgi:hypothetical protein
MIQSSAVDFLHIFITNMEYLISEYGIDATYSISIHDMIQYISSNEDRHRCALAFQIAHMYTRAYFRSRAEIFRHSFLSGGGIMKTKCQISHFFLMVKKYRLKFMF